MRRTRALLLTAVLSASMVPLTAGPAAAIDRTVPCGDTTALGEAILDANANPDLSTIRLATGCTYTLVLALPEITAPLALHGNDATLARSPTADSFGLLRSDALLDVRDLTLRTGVASSGGAIHAGAGLLLRDAVLDGNSASNGGAVRVVGQATIESTLFSANIAGGAGAALNASGGPVTISSSAFVGNALGGAQVVLSDTGTATVTNTTVTGDESTFGLLAQQATAGTTVLRVVASTITGSPGGGAIVIGTSDAGADIELELGSSVVVGGSGTACTIDGSGGGSQGITDLGYSVTDDLSCLLDGTSLQNDDPMLEALSDDTDPNRPLPTRPLHPDSPARGFVPAGEGGNLGLQCANSVPISVDQNGRQRVDGADDDCDAGADESSATVPTTTITSGPTGSSSDSSFTFTASPSAGSSFECRVDDGGYEPCSSGVDLAELPDGPHTFRVRAVRLGVVDPTPATRSWTLDRVAPSVSFPTATQTVSTDEGAEFEFRADEPATFRCSVDGAAFSACTSPVVLRGLAVGDHTFRVRATDAAGNARTATRSFEVFEPTDDGGGDTGTPGDTIDFTDDDDSVFEADIERLAAAGITRGCNPPTNDRFCPDAPVTRGQFAAFFVRALGLTDGGSVDFTDDDGNIFEADIEKLATAGITRGCNPPTNDRFCPDDALTRGQFAAFMVRAQGLTASDPAIDFTDDDTSIFEADIEKLATAGITRGCNPPTNDRFCPTQTLTRGQLAAFFVRAGLTD